MKLIRIIVVVLFVCCLENVAWSSTFTTKMHDEEFTTEMELVTLEENTYFETKDAGVYLGSTRDMVTLLTPMLLKDGATRKPGKVDGIAARVKGHPISGFRATAGEKGMHIFVDLGGGGMNLGKGMLYDVLKLHREIVFEEGNIKLPRMENGKEIGTDIYTCSKGARLCTSNQGGKLYITGISHKYLPKDVGSGKLP